MVHAFSVEMKCRKHVKHMSVSSDPHAVLEIKGANGVIRIDIGEDDLRKMLSRKEEKKKDS